VDVESRILIARTARRRRREVVRRTHAAGGGIARDSPLYSGFSEDTYLFIDDVLVSTL